MKAEAMAELAQLAASVERLAKPGMKPKELIAAVCEEHPTASKKDVSRATSYAVIIASEQKSDRITDLHEIAVQTRNSYDESQLDDH
ncbi:hypothetical protein [Neorhizobium sp. P12A]|uniref:hypothetical protein n=1 Tax=Neorhizobium sp. P12A TaxID=2268027 RepID=UPI0011EEB2CB|nr:hypothetical protein [Neorhizobium sp. P12A]